MNKIIIRSSQHGFSKGKSCLTKPIIFYNDRNSLTDEGETVDIVLDFRNTFDAVPDKILIEKLLKYGLDLRQ